MCDARVIFSTFAAALAPPIIIIIINMMMMPGARTLKIAVKSSPMMKAKIVRMQFF
jgi:hypothetical protein